MYLFTNKGTKNIKITIRLLIPILQIRMLWPAMSTNFTQNWREHCSSIKSLIQAGKLFIKPSFP